MPEKFFLDTIPRTPKPPKQNWRLVVLAELRARDGDHCYLCKTALLATEMQIDHIIPEYLGGDHRLHNLGIACHDCNSKKGHLIVAFWVPSGVPWYSYQAQLRQ